MIRPGGRVLGQAFAAAILAVGLVALASASAQAASPPDAPLSQISNPAPECINGKWRVHWLIHNSDSADIKATVALNGGTPGKFSPAVIPPGSDGHYYLDVDNGWSAQAQFVVSWATAAGATHSGGSSASVSGNCEIATVTIPTAPPNTTPPKPGATTTVPARPGATTTVPGDPNASTTTSVLAQTNGVDPASGAAGDSTTTVDPTTDTSPDSVELAATTAATKPSSSSGAIWVVVGIFLAAALGGAVLLLLTRRSAGSDDATPTDP